MDGMTTRAPTSVPVPVDLLASAPLAGVLVGYGRV